MKSFITWIFMILLFFMNLDCDLVNLNPDPDGDPWYVGKLRPLTDQDLEMLNELPRLTLTDSQRDRPLPDRIDNTEHPYFRPIFTQEGGSCGQASGVGYNFTYEINFERGLTANIPENQYPTHYTWNFLNGGFGGGSWYWDGWEIIKHNGCPNVEDYGGMSYGGERRWLSGYEEYFNGMHNRTYEFFAIEVSTPEGLQTLKNWFFDHLDGSDAGGLVNFGAGVSGYIMETLPPGTPEEGKSVIIQWDQSVNHAMTFVGYDDSICYDYNNDGYYTNDVDINNDGIVDMKDWEIGGLIIANSWGLGWGDQGKSYMMYKLLAEATEEGGIWANVVHAIITKETYNPLLTIKTTLEHDSRNKLRIYAGVASDSSAVEPELVHYFPLFNYQGGALYMQGGNLESDKQIQIGLDITPLLSGINDNEPARFFLMIDNQDPDNVGTGEIIEFSIVDYTQDPPLEIICPLTNIPIVNNETTILSVVKSIEWGTINITSSYLPDAIPGEEYSYQLQAENGTPPYNWSLIMSYPESCQQSVIPTVYDNLLIPSNFDDGFEAIELDFDFPFYFDDFDQILISTDGSILFGDSFEYVRSEENIISTKAITPYGTDLELFTYDGDGIWYYMNENSIIIYWRTSRYSDPDFDAEFAVKLSDSGEINFYYGNEITPSSDWCAGISWGDYSSFTISSLSGNPDIPQDQNSIFTRPPFPDGMILNNEGLLSGIPTEENQTWQLTFKVVDYNFIFDTRTLDFTTIAMDNGNDELVSAIRLNQNYPNPFHSAGIGRGPATVISYQLNQSSNVTISIYNLRGQLVKTLVEEIKPAGEYQVSWDGRDDENHNLPSGLYLYRLDTGEAILTRKMILID